jgi:hypothetical protein
MNTKREDRAAAGIPRWAERRLPLRQRQLFSGSDEVPRFSKIARSYLLHVGGLDWTKINPDIFGSMIQAVAEDEERGELGMHYTSVPNILKVLNPLFLDDLRAKLEEAGDNPRMLLNLRKRIARIRVFDPACGSGNFLVIAYKEMRAIEAEINRRRGEPDRASEIPVTNFRGIELRDFPAEIARLALVIAEYQCDVLYRGQKLALAEFLPLRNENWITCGNALRLDWLSICPPTEEPGCEGARPMTETYFAATRRTRGQEQTPLDQAKRSTSRTRAARQHQYKYRLSGLCGHRIRFAGRPVGLGRKSNRPKLVFTGDTVMEAGYIGPYLVPDQSVIVAPSARPVSSLSEMTYGSMPNDNGGLILTPDEARDLVEEYPLAARFVKRLLGSNGAIHGQWRYCLWISTADLPDALAIKPIRERVEIVRGHRTQSSRATTQELAKTPHLFGEIRHSDGQALAVPCHSAEDRPYLPFALIDGDTIVDNSAIRLPDHALYASRLHLVWIATVCGQLETRYRYSNTLGWNTFPVPTLTDKNKADLTRCAEDILLAREHHFPATIADLYDPENMPADLRAAHDRNDEVLERIYIGRRFKNDTERLEKLFDLYTKMTASAAPAKGKKRKAGANA